MFILKAIERLDISPQTTSQVIIQVVQAALLMPILAQRTHLNTVHYEMLALAPTMSQCLMLDHLLRQRLIVTKVVTTMQMPIPRTLMELFTTKIISHKDINFTKLNQSKSKWMKRVITDQEQWIDLSLKMKTRTLRTESMVLLVARRMVVSSWAIVPHLRDTKNHGWKIDQIQIETAIKELQECLVWHLQTGLKLRMFIQEIQTKALFQNRLQWFTTQISTTMFNQD